MEISLDEREIEECWQYDNDVMFSFAKDGRVTCTVDNIYGSTSAGEGQISKDDMRILGEFLLKAAASN